jgi:hypothetical protein
MPPTPTVFRKFFTVELNPKLERGNSVVLPFLMDLGEESFNEEKSLL